MYSKNAMNSSIPNPENEQNFDLEMEVQESREGDENVSWLRQQIRVFRNRARGITDQPQASPVTSPTREETRIYSPREEARREALQSVETHAETLSEELRWRNIRRAVLAYRIKINNVLRNKLGKKVHKAPWKWFVMPRGKKTKKRYEGSLKDMVREAREEVRNSGGQKPTTFLNEAPLQNYPIHKRVLKPKGTWNTMRAWLRLGPKERFEDANPMTPHEIATEARNARANITTSSSQAPLETASQQLSAPVPLLEIEKRIKNAITARGITEEQSFSLEARGLIPDVKQKNLLIDRELFNRLARQIPAPSGARRTRFSGKTISLEAASQLLGVGLDEVTEAGSAFEEDFVYAHCFYPGNHLQAILQAIQNLTDEQIASSTVSSPSLNLHPPSDSVLEESIPTDSGLPPVPDDRIQILRVLIPPGHKAWISEADAARQVGVSVEDLKKSGIPIDFDGECDVEDVIHLIQDPKAFTSQDATHSGVKLAAPGTDENFLLIPISLTKERRISQLRSLRNKFIDRGEAAWYVGISIAGLEICGIPIDADGDCEVQNVIRLIEDPQAFTPKKAKISSLRRAEEMFTDDEESTLATPVTDVPPPAPTNITLPSPQPKGAWNKVKAWWRGTPAAEAESSPALPEPSSIADTPETWEAAERVIRESAPPDQKRGRENLPLPELFLVPTTREERLEGLQRLYRHDVDDLPRELAAKYAGVSVDALANMGIEMEGEKYSTRSLIRHIQREIDEKLPVPESAEARISLLEEWEQKEEGRSVPSALAAKLLRVAEGDFADIAKNIQYWFSSSNMRTGGYAASDLIALIRKRELSPGEDTSATPKKDEERLLTSDDEMFTEESEEKSSPQPVKSEAASSVEWVPRERKFMELADAAKVLGVTPDQLVEMRSNGDIQGFRDGGSWKFKEMEVARVRDERFLLSPLELPADDEVDLDAPSDSGGSGISSLELPEDDS